MSVEKIGRYVISGELGRGAMGVVYKATDPTIGRTVALKTMRLDVHAEKHDEMLRRFQNEAKAAGALSHPNIVTIYDAAEADGIFYIAMEYIEGTTLAQLLHERRSISAQELVDIGTQICAGLQYAHFRKVVHRDIKPPNIMLAPAAVKIMDFGIAKAGASLTHTGEVLGTPHYMSPEQVRGRDLDGRSDIFSMGVMLYEMVTGEKPFAGQNVTAVIYKIVNEQPIPPRELDVTIHPGLSMVITKCLAKDPEDRYQEASDLSTALKSYKIVSIPRQFTTTGTQPIEPPAVVVTPKPSPAPTIKMPAATVATSAPVTTMRSAAAAKPALDHNAQTTEMRVPAPLASASQSRKTVMLFVVLAVILLAGALAIRMFTQRPDNASVQPSSVTPVQPEAPPAETSDDRIAKATQEISDNAERVAGEHVSRATKAPAAAIGVGDLRITSNPPGAQVTVDGVAQAYYVTPFNTPPIKAGMHALTVSAPGLPPQTRDVEVVARKRTAVDFQLTGDNAIYNINSAPSGADIIIDGVASGARTPAQIPLKAGAHKITFHMDGFSPVELMTQSAPGEMVNLAPRLQMRNSVDISQQAASETPSLGSLARMRRPGSAEEIPEGKGAVLVRTRPKGVTIVVDGHTIPRVTPFRFPIRSGSHTVVLQKPGYQAVTRVIQVEDGKVSEIDELLLPQ
jgi:eukaryotic-like serine/threonine-protein kinase